MDFKAEGNKIAGCPREPELCASKVERYEDAFLLHIYPAYSPVKRWIPDEKKVTEEVKKQDAVTLGKKRWQEVSVSWKEAAAVLVAAAVMLGFGVPARGAF